MTSHEHVFASGYIEDGQYTHVQRDGITKCLQMTGDQRLIKLS